MKMTLWGFYNYYPELFDNLIFPEAIDHAQAVDAILMRAGEFEVVYPNLEFLLYQIEAWGKQHYRTFDKWSSALALDYDPLYNYDRTEQESNVRRVTGSNSQSATDTGTNNESVTEQEAGTGANTEKVSAYDSSTFENRQKTDTETALSRNTSRAVTTGATSAIMGNNAQDETYEHSSRVYGNIGVTTSSAMLREYLDMQSWNIYNHIADLFVDEFCILIY